MSKFKVGDRVIRIKKFNPTEGCVYTVIGVSNRGKIELEWRVGHWYDAGEFELEMPLPEKQKRPYAGRSRQSRSGSRVLCPCRQKQRRPYHSGQAVAW